MDWARAKTILIAMFLVLNIFLLFNIYQKESETINISQKEILEIQSILKSNNISLDAGIQTKIKPKSFLKVEDVTYTEDGLVVSFVGDNNGLQKEKISNSATRYKKDGKSLEIYSNKKIIFKDENPLGNIKGFDKNQILKYVKDYLELKGLYQKYSIVDSFNTINGGYEIGFKQEFKGYQVIGSYIKVGLNEKGINKLEIIWFNPIQFADSPKAIKTPLEVLLIFAKDVQNMGSISVKSMDVAYYLPPEETKNADIYAIPVWKIQTADEIYYYNAYEGYLETKTKT